MLGLGPMLGEHVKQELRDADEVDNLCNAEERSNDQGSAVCPFQEGHGPFLLPDLPGEKRHTQVSVHPTTPAELLAMPWLFCLLPETKPRQTLPPGAASTADHPPSPSALQKTLQERAPSLHLVRSRSACLGLDGQLRQPHACIKRFPCSKGGANSNPQHGGQPDRKRL